MIESEKINKKKKIIIKNYNLPYLQLNFYEAFLLCLRCSPQIKKNKGNSLSSLKISTKKPLLLTS